MPAWLLLMKTVASTVPPAATVAIMRGSRGPGLFTLGEGDPYQLLISASYTDTRLHNLWVAKCKCEPHTKDFPSKNRLSEQLGTQCVVLLSTFSLFGN